jgi:HK97 family phage major capsid protein
MINLDQMKQKKAEIMAKMHQAMQENNEETFTQAFTEYTDMLQEAVMSEARGLIQSADNTVLAGRGVRALTSEETQYYDKLIQALRSGSPRQALSDFDVVLPKTIIDSIFDDITEDHPLLDAVNFMPTGALVEMLVSIHDGRQLATWDELTTKIVTELTSGFSKIDLTQMKLSAFLPIGKAMLDLGPAWMDRYVRTILSEAIANGLEKGIIDGSGLKQPIGMRRDPKSSLDPSTGYAVLTKSALTVITPETYGAILADLAVGPNGLYRKIDEVLLVVNPVDFFKKIMPATVFQRVDGTYATNIFPFPTRVVQSVWVPSNEMILGIGKRYFMALGTSKGGKVEYSDEYHFLEDERVYLTKLYGNGKPLDNKSFKLLDITNLKPFDPRVFVTNWPNEANPMEVAPVYDARLAKLTIGSLTLSPAFNKSVMVYTAATTNATNAINAVAIDGEATIAIKVNGVAAENGAAATWADGVNTVDITVTSGTETETYSVTVTKSAG